MNLKSPDQIKKGLECCIEGGCSTCPFNIPNQYIGRCIKNLTTAADSLIQQLEATVSEKEKVVAELSGKIGRLESKLNEAVNDLHRAVNCPATLVACEFCKNNEVCPHDGTCDAVENDRWQWRGISKEGH